MSTENKVEQTELENAASEDRTDTAGAPEPQSTSEVPEDSEHRRSPADARAEVLDAGSHSQVGRVLSSKMDKTATVLIERQVKHSLYGKYIKRSTKVHAHDEENTCGEGDTVRIVSTRPRSKTKSWQVVEVVERAQ